MLQKYATDVIRKSIRTANLLKPLTMKNINMTSRLVSSTIICSSSNTSRYDEGKHRSNAEELVNQVPPIEVEGHIAVCDGGGGILGHPIEYIQLDTISEEPAVCKYCGLRFISKHH